MATDIDELEPRLTGTAYNAKVLAEVLNAKPREIHALLRGHLRLIGRRTVYVLRPLQLKSG